MKSRNIGECGENLAFIISPPRAGSTVLQRALGCHPAIHTMSEPWVALPILKALDPVHDPEVDQIGRRLCAQAVNEFLATVSPDKQQRLWLRACRAALTVLYDAALSSAASDEKTVFLDKTPRYYLIINQLFAVFPEATFVYLVRHPLSMFASIYRNWTADPLANHYNDLVMAPQRMRASHLLFTRRFSFITYEDLVCNPSETLRKVLAAFPEQVSVLGDIVSTMIDYGSTPSPLRGEMGANKDVERFGSLNTFFRANVKEEITAFFKNLPAAKAEARKYLDKLGDEVINWMGYCPEEAWRLCK
jgi:hypothetical protein